MFSLNEIKDDFESKSIESGISAQPFSPNDKFSRERQISICKKLENQVLDLLIDNEVNINLREPERIIGDTTIPSSSPHPPPPGFDIINEKEFNQDSKNKLNCISPIINIKNISDSSSYNLFSLNEKYSQKNDYSNNIQNILSPSHMLQKSLSSSRLGLGLELKIDIDDIIKQPLRNIFILWDIDSCPIHSSDDTSKLTKKLLEYVSRNFQEENSLKNDFDIFESTIIKQTIFLEDNEFYKSIGKNISLEQLNILQNECNYKVITHSRGCVENVMRDEINDNIHQSKHSSNSYFVLIIGDDLAFKIIPLIRLESFSNLILIVNATNNDAYNMKAFEKFATKIYSWNDIRYNKSNLDFDKVTYKYICESIPKETEDIERRFYQTNLKTSPTSVVSDFNSFGNNQINSLLSPTSLSSLSSLPSSTNSSPISRLSFNQSKKHNNNDYNSNFIFQDREAGIFYTNFEKEFRKYILFKYKVDINIVVETPSSDKKETNKNNHIRSELRTPPLRVEFIGVKDNVLAVRNYLDSIGTKIKSYQIHFPLTFASKYRELYKYKYEQDSKLKQNRSNSKSLLPLNPLNALHFINIRMKPPLNTPKIFNRSLDLQVDVTVTLSGSQENTTIIKELLRFFHSIPTKYNTSFIEIPITNQLAKVLIVRTTRDEFIKEHNLISIKFLDDNCKSQGTSFHQAKIWAHTKKDLNLALSFITERGGIIINNPILSSVSASKSITTSEQQPKCLNNLDNYEKKYSNEENKLSYASVTSPSLSLSSPTNAFVKLITWPHVSCRYILLNERLKDKLNELIIQLRLSGLIIVSPYRDKSDTSICMKLEGVKEKVEKGYNEINNFLYNISKSMSSVQIILTDNQRQILVSQDLIKMKEIQGDVGVHIILEPSSSDLDNCTSRYDLRLPYSTNDTEENKELIKILIPTAALSIEVTAFNCIKDPWISDVDAILLIVDTNFDIELSSKEIEQLNSGQVLVNTLNGKKILRVNHSNLFNKITNNNAVIQGNNLSRDISRGLSVAESLNISSIGIIIPKSLNCLSNLSLDYIYKIILESVAGFCKRVPVSNLNKIVFIDIINNNNTDSLINSKKNLMVLTMLKLLEANTANKYYNSMDSSNDIKMIHLSTSIDSLSISGDILSSTLINNQRIRKPSHLGPIVLRGLPEGVKKGINSIKKIIIE